MLCSAVSLSHLNTMGLQASAARLIQYESTPPTLAASEPLYILGGGSNTLFVEPFEGCVVQPVSQSILYSESEHYWQIEVDAGVVWHELVLDSLSKGVQGLENLALIPGLVGAAPVQNIGAYGVQFADLCESVTAVNLRTGEQLQLAAAACQFAYRDSIFKRQLAAEWLVTKVVLKLCKQWQPNLAYGGLQELAELEAEPSASAICQQVIQIRQAKLPDPQQLGNVGSFFKNPYLSESALNQLLIRYPDMVHFREGSRYKLAAGWLIDRLGWKGKRNGGAAVHHKQALVLVNQGGASAQDVVGLAVQIQRQVAEVFGVQLEPEACLVARNGLITLEQAYEITHL